MDLEPPAPPPGAPEGVVRVSEADSNGFLQDVAAGPSHHALADEPRSFGGTDRGMSPYGFLAAGLGACTSMTIRLYARRKGWPLDHVSVEVTHDRVHAKDAEADGEGGSDKVDVFRRVVRLEGELDRERRARLMEIADRLPRPPHAGARRPRGNRGGLTPSCRSLPGKRGSVLRGAGSARRSRRARRVGDGSRPGGATDAVAHARTGDQPRRARGPSDAASPARPMLAPRPLSRAARPSRTCRGGSPGRAPDPHGPAAGFPPTAPRAPTPRWPRGPLGLRLGARAGAGAARAGHVSWEVTACTTAR